MRKRIGFFPTSVIRTLGLNIPAGTPIYIADSNIEHMKTSHPEDYKKYGSELQNIIANPDYVGKNTKDDSIEFTKEYLYFDENVIEYILLIIFRRNHTWQNTDATESTWKWYASLRRFCARSRIPASPTTSSASPRRMSPPTSNSQRSISPR